MSDSDDYPQELQAPNSDLLQEIASNSSGGRRKSIRLAGRYEPITDKADLLITQLQDHGIMPAPGLLTSQLRELADSSSIQPGPSSHHELDPSTPADFSAAPRSRSQKDQEISCIQDPGIKAK
ncbi:unnamed protein product [Pleuronectes platessa]|uniref:Uncharacterized protein n=1 Tax=Pleuronectes platessa TaxID=8262 RepID=A0A9N7UI95_PLEPL|nr:unnamed protein product [Pleuronectes platessa]